MHFKCINWGMAVIQSSFSLLRLSSLSRRSFLRTGQLRPFIPILIWASALSLGNRGLWWRRRWWQRRLSYPTPGTQGQRSDATAEGHCQAAAAANEHHTCVRVAAAARSWQDAPICRLTLSVTAGLDADFPSISCIPVVRCHFFTLKFSLV